MNINFTIKIHLLFTHFLLSNFSHFYFICSAFSHCLTSVHKHYLSWGCFSCSVMLYPLQHVKFKLKEKLIFICSIERQPCDSRHILRAKHDISISWVKKGCCIYAVILFLFIFICIGYIVISLKIHITAFSSCARENILWKCKKTLPCFMTIYS